MIEVMLFVAGKRDTIIEAETPEDAVFGAQVIWDEAVDYCYARGATMQLGFYVQDRLVQLVDRRPGA